MNLEGKVITLLVPTFNEIEAVENFFSKIIDPISEIKRKYGLSTEFLFVDNASTDNTIFSIYENCKKRDYSFKIIRWIRNYGVMTSIYGGLKFISKKNGATIIFDFDLQDPPELIVHLVDSWVAGSVLVTGLRIKRAENFKIALGRRIFRLIYKLLGQRNEAMVESGVWLLDEKIIQDLISNPPSTIYLAGVLQNRNYSRTVIPYERLKRTTGKSNFSLIKYLRYGFEGLISVPFKFMRLVFLTGAVLVASTIGLLFFVLFRKYFLDVSPTDGVTLIFVVLVTLFSFVILLLGILGEYISRIFENTGRIEETVVDQILED